MPDMPGGCGPCGGSQRARCDCSLRLQSDGGQRNLDYYRGGFVAQLECEVAGYNSERSQGGPLREVLVLAVGHEPSLGSH